jgi:glycosyltransferase involved in cell wall biosynthesis
MDLKKSISRSYAIVTPVKDEEKYLPKTITSVLKQTVKPQIWIIINDRSNDRTGEIIEDVSASYHWIVGCESGLKDNVRKPGGEAVLHQGMRRLNLSDYDFFVRMDGDISFESDYFEKIFVEFEKNAALGIASGVCYFPVNRGFSEEKHPRFHTRGPLKTYRITCLSDIGGLESGLGWDTVDEIKANMLGWMTRSFPALKIIHYRKTQTASGALNGMRNLGQASFYLGYHPIFLILRAIRHMALPPYVVGGIEMLIGFCSGYIKRQTQIQDADFIKFLRKQQLNRLLAKKTMWK